jgi:hypothetical protein
VVVNGARSGGPVSDQKMPFASDRSRVSLLYLPSWAAIMARRLIGYNINMDRPPERVAFDSYFSV